MELLKTSRDPTVLAISAHDIGQFIRHGGDKAKQYIILLCLHVKLTCSRTITDLGGKTRVMELMGHENGDVRYEALMTVQRLMSQHV